MVRFESSRDKYFLFFFPPPTVLRRTVSQDSGPCPSLPSFVILCFRRFRIFSLLVKCALIGTSPPVRYASCLTYGLSQHCVGPVFLPPTMGFSPFFSLPPLATSFFERRFIRKG